MLRPKLRNLAVVSPPTTYTVFTRPATGPCGPVGPVGPVAPVGPVEPVGPSIPSKLTLYITGKSVGSLL